MALEPWEGLPTESGIVRASMLYSLRKLSQVEPEAEATAAWYEELRPRLQGKLVWPIK